MVKRCSQSVEADWNVKKRKCIDFSLISSDLSVLSKFVEMVEDGNAADLVESAISLGNVENILMFFDNYKTRKPDELLVIIKAVSVIILKSATVLHAKFPLTARSLAEGVLEDMRLQACYSALSRRQTPELLKMTLQLFASVVTAGSDLARGLLHSITFDRNELVFCSKRRSRTDDYDVRTCFLNFWGAFVFLNNNLILRELVTKKSAVFLLINEVFLDKYSNVALILQLLQIIAENKTISKTHKMRIFNHHCLQQLMYLYLWRGDGLNFAEVLMRDESEVNQEQLACIRDAVHKLLLHLMTSKSGLVFSSWKRDGDIRANDLILHGLTCAPMESVHLDTLRADLVLQALKVCLDIVGPYLDHLAPCLFPRESDNWFSAINFVIKIYETTRIHTIHFLTNVLNHSRNIQHVVRSIADLSSLSVKMVAPVDKALQFQESTRVVSKAGELMNLLLDHLKITLTWLRLTNFPSAIGFTASDVKDSLLDTLLQRMPNANYVHVLKELFNLDMCDPSLITDQLSFAEQNMNVEKFIAEAEPTEDSESEKLQAFLTDWMHCSWVNISKPIRKQLKIFKDLNINEPPILSEKVLISLNNLKYLTKTCFKEYFDVPLVYKCLSNAIHLFCKNGDTFTTAKPKFFLKSLIKQSHIHSLLSGKYSMNSDCHADKVDLHKTDHFALTQLRILKEYLFTLIFELVNLTPDVCLNYIPIMWYLASYNATLSSLDQTILKILFRLEQYSTGILMQSSHFTPTLFIWGDILRMHYRFDAESQCKTLPVPIMFHEPNISSLQNLLDAECILHSATNFPVHRKWLGNPGLLHTDCLETAECDGVLDPCFLLHAFYHHLRYYQKSNAAQYLKMFYTKNCLYYTIVALSSYSKHIRFIARSIIALYRNSLEQWDFNKQKHLDANGYFPERLQLIFVLDLLRNSLSSGGGLSLGGGSRRAWMLVSASDTGGRLTVIHANFFARCVQILNKPDHPIYQSIWNRLLAKPAVNLNEVPDFLRLFFATDHQFRVRRQWISRLCAESLTDAADYLVMERSRVFKHFLNVYTSPSSDKNFQMAVLQLLHAATKHPRLIHTLVRYHALPLWLSRNSLTNCSPAHAKWFNQIFENINSTFMERTVESPTAAIFTLLKEEFRNFHETWDGAKDTHQLHLCKNKPY